MGVRRGPVSVLLDDQAFMLQRRGGVSRYFVSLMQEFRADDLGVRVVAPYRDTRNEHLVEFDPARFRVKSGPLRSHPHVLRAGNRLRFGRVGRVDVIHHTYYFARRLRRPTTPSVVTVYDMTPEQSPELFAGARPHREKYEYIREAAAVICISEQVRTDLLDIYGDVEAPVFVTPLGVSEAFAIPRPNPWPGSGYVLYVGTRDHYKDFRTVVDAAAQMRTAGRTVRVMCAGGGPFSGDEREYLASRGLEGSFLQAQLTDVELVGAYQHAAGFVFPSRREGFGLPILEAFRASCPVLVSDIPVFREVAGEAAAYFQPGNSTALSLLLIRMLDDSAFREELVNRGRARVSRFSWRRTAELTAAVYRSVTGEVG